MSNLENDLVDQPEEEPLDQPKEASADSLRVLEAVLFASDELLTTARLKTILPGTPDAREIGGMVEKINRQLQKERHPFEIVEIGGGYQFKTVAYYHPWVRQIFREKAAKRLSIQALECLSIIAYRQPLSKAEIEAIRGVLSDGAMKTLLEKRLITITGRSEKPGRPLLYGTTPDFLKYFGLNKISDLPRIEEFEAMIREKMESMNIDELKNAQDQALQDAAATDEASIEITMPSDAPRNAGGKTVDDDSGSFEVSVPEAVAQVQDAEVFEEAVQNQPQEPAEPEPAPADHVMDAETVLQPVIKDERPNGEKPVVTVKRKKRGRPPKKEVEATGSETNEENAAPVIADEAVVEVAAPEETQEVSFEKATIEPEPPPSTPEVAVENDADDALFEVSATPADETPPPEAKQDGADDAVFEVKM